MLGYDELTERAYELLLRRRSLTRPVLRRALQAPAEAVDAALESLAAGGLVTLIGDDVSLVPPHDALNNLVVARLARLREERSQIEEARRQVLRYLTDHRAPIRMFDETISIEVVRGREALGLISHLASMAKGELLFLRPDQWQNDDDRLAEDLVLDLLQAGHSTRVIYPPDVVELAPDMVRRRTALGVKVRILPDVPTRLAVFGSSAAMMPARFGGSPERVLLIRQEGLVESLRHLFELLWSKAVEVPALEPTRSAERDRVLLLRQLAAGARDDQLARTFGVSLRTIRRRVAELLTDLGAESRFQAGLEASRRGWL
jgi:hypothetical protein